MFAIGGFTTLLDPKYVDLLIDRDIEEHREDRRCRSVDGHRHRRVRRTQIEAGIHIAHVIQRRDGHPGGADLAIDVRAQGRVTPIQRDRVECR